MELIECLAPRPISKAILALAIFALAVPFINYDTGIRCIMAPCPSQATSSIAIYLYTAHFSLPATMILSLDYFIAAVGLVLSYLVACALFLAYSHFKSSIKSK